MAATIKVPSPEKVKAPAKKTVAVSDEPAQWIYVNSGGETTAYKVVDGEIVVEDESHVPALLGAIKGSELKPEPPAEEEVKSEAPTKE